MLDGREKNLNVFQGDTAMFWVVCTSWDPCVCGYIDSVWLKEPVVFNGLVQMLLLIDQTCEQAMNANTGSADVMIQPRIRKVHEDSEETTSPKSREIFLIHVIAMQNASLQGTMVHARESRKKIHFRSALELMHIMNSYFVKLTEENEASTDEKMDRCI